MNAAPTPPRLEPIFNARVAVAAPRSLGKVAGGERRIVDITGGEVAGPQLAGRILPGGADWQILREDGTAVLEARYTIEAADGALVYVRNYGYRHGPTRGAGADRARARRSIRRSITSAPRRCSRPPRRGTTG